MQLDKPLKSREKLVRMGNQIATFFLSQPEEGRLKALSDHINANWDPRMRREFFRAVADGAEGFLPLLKEAVPLVRRPSEPGDADVVRLNPDNGGAVGDEVPGA